MKRLILSRLWMLIGIIILTTGQAWAKPPQHRRRFLTLLRNCAMLQLVIH